MTLMDYNQTKNKTHNQVRYKARDQTTSKLKVIKPWLQAVVRLREQLFDQIGVPIKHQVRDSLYGVR